MSLRLLSNNNYIMHKSTAFLLLVFLLFSCKKESSDFIWERSFSPGDALFISSAPDSGFLSCGLIGNLPYLIKLDKDRKISFDYSYGYPGQLSSAWSDNSRIISGGSSEGKMLLISISNLGNEIWDNTISAGFTIDLTTLFYYGDGTFLAVGSADRDADIEPSGLLFVRFDTTGEVILKKEITDVNFVSANYCAVDNSGNIYLPLTRRIAGAKSKASVAKYNSDFQKLWETVLYNNPDVSSACLGIMIDGSDSVYVTGKTEVTKSDGVLDNSYLASLSLTGIIGKKKYLENSNSGSAIISNNSDRIMLLNRNCFIINNIDPVNGYSIDIIRMFSVCNSYTTDSFGSDLDLDYEGNILVSGSKGGNFYLALKSSSQ
jgi:hypothetical protein